MSVTLRPLLQRDATWLDAWIGTVARSVGYEGIEPELSTESLLRRTHEGGVAAHVIERDGPAGLLIYRVAGRSATIEFIGTPPERARRGAGMEAAVLVEEVLRARGATKAYAPVPAAHGIAMYFWIRLGYRPLERSSWPCARAGVAWLVRDLR